MNLIIEGLNKIDESSQWHVLNGFTFTVKGDKVEIQAGDNYGNKITTDIETARKVYKHIKDKKIISKEHGLDTFHSVGVIQGLVDKYKK